MSAQDEMPPCECHLEGQEGFNICRPCYALGELGITREEYTTMRAAVEQCERLELEVAALDEAGVRAVERCAEYEEGHARGVDDARRQNEFVDKQEAEIAAERARADRAEAVADRADSLMHSMQEHAKRPRLVALLALEKRAAYLEDEAVRLQDRASKAEAALASMTAERDKHEGLSNLRSDGLDASLAKTKAMEAQRDEARAKTRAGIANAIDARRELFSETGAPGTYTDVPQDAYVEGMMDAYVIARDWGPLG